MQTIQNPLVPEITNPALTISPASSNVPALLPSVLATKLGSSVAVVDAVVRSVVDSDTIRRQAAENPGKLVTALTIQLQNCAEQYTGCVKTDEMVFDECVEFVMTRFGYLNISEIRNAFRLAAGGELGDVSLAAYHGVFTVTMLGKVLTAYKEYRDRLSKEVREAEKQVEYAEIQVLQSTNWDAAAWSERRLNTLLGMEELEWRHCTAYDYDHFTGTGQMPITQEEKQTAWDESFSLAHAEVAAGAVNGNQSFRFLLQKINLGQKDEGFSAKRMVIAKQLLVHRWIQVLKMKST